MFQTFLIKNKLKFFERIQYNTIALWGKEPIVQNISLKITKPFEIMTEIIIKVRWNSIYGTYRERCETINF